MTATVSSVDANTLSMLFRLADPAQSLTVREVRALAGMPGFATLVMRQRVGFHVLSACCAADLNSVADSLQLYHKSAVQALADLQQARTALLACGDLPCPVLLTKGWALQEMYPGSYVRQSQDIDLFVRTGEDAFTLARHLQETGHYVLHDSPWLRYYPRTSAPTVMVTLLDTRFDVQVEIHGGGFPMEGAAPLSTELLWAGAEPAHGPFWAASALAAGLLFLAEMRERRALLVRDLLDWQQVQFTLNVTERHALSQCAAELGLTREAEELERARSAVQQGHACPLLQKRNRVRWTQYCSQAGLLLGTATFFSAWADRAMYAQFERLPMLWTSRLNRVLHQGVRRRLGGGLFYLLLDGHAVSTRGTRHRLISALGNGVLIALPKVTEQDILDFSGSCQ